MIALLPSFLTVEAMAVTADPVPARLDVPASPAAGSSTAAPVQRSGSADGLPHLVDPAATQPDGVGKISDSKRPKKALPLEKKPSLSDKPATNGLNSPPPLSWEEAERADTSPSSPAQARATGLSKVSTRSDNASLSDGTSAVVTQAAASLPVVSGLAASPGQAVSGLWTLSSTQPTFSAYGTDPQSRPLRLEAQVEHDPSAASQGSGLIWSGTGAVYGGACSSSIPCWVQSPVVTAGKLKDGWLIRWRVRASTSGGVTGAWSQWQAARVDTSKPVVSGVAASP
ncbi:hypothetical protein FXF51_60135, partial [Nonomuraea sp. PA05]